MCVQEADAGCGPTGAASCADAGDDPNSDASSDADLRGRLDTQSTLLFSETAVGESSTETLVLHNIGGGPLEISDISLFEAAGGEFDGQQEFFIESMDTLPIALAPGESTEVSVTFTPQNTTLDEGELEIISDDPQGPQRVVELRTMAPAPSLHVTPSSAQFSRVEPGGSGVDKILTVQNVGSASLRITDIYVSGSDRYSWSIPDPDQPGRDNDSDQWPTSLEAGQSFDVRVTFQPEDSLPESAELVIASNDPESPTTIVPLNGNSGAPCMRVSPADEIDFGQGSLGQTSYRSVWITNCSRSVLLELDEIAITDDAGGIFSLDAQSLPGGLPGGTASIDPGETTNITLQFAPDEQRSYTGELLIDSDDPVNDRLRIPVSGVGSDNDCPTAVAEASVTAGGPFNTSVQTIPQNTVYFDSSNSFDPDGSIDRYEWTILSRPQGSTQSILPSASEPNPRLFIDMNGTYEIELRAFDDEGAASCGQRAIVTIVAEVNEDLHIQLFWDTPADPDPSDDFGADLDLHYLHPNGNWTETPWDIFSTNARADWGVQGDSSDDPRLLNDVTDGDGPEDIIHDNLEDVAYRVGVHYYDDNTLGPSYATVRIYVQGQLEFELKDKYMPGSDAFWDVATIENTGSTITNTDQMHQDIP